MLKVGKLYRFDYLQGSQGGFRIGRVLKVRDTYANPVSQEAVKANPIHRSRYLLTVRELNGQCRQMYGHSIYGVKNVSVVGKIGLWLIGAKV